MKGQQVLDGTCSTEHRQPNTPQPQQPVNSGWGLSSEGYDQRRLDASSTSLDNTLQNRTLVDNHSNLNSNGYTWSTKQKRAYIKAKAGERSHPGQLQRFLTLTSSPGSVEAGNDLGIDFSVFKLRVKRLTPYKLLKKGYLTIGQLRYFYPGKNLHQPLTMDYFKVRTDEGFGVLHILYYGDYIPQKWLSNTWESIHQAPITWIKTGDYLKYVINQYCSGQSHFVNSSCSEGWAFKGYMRTWDYLRRFMSLDRRIEVMQALQTFGRVEIIHHGERSVLEAGQPPPQPVVVFIGSYDSLEGRMIGEWVDRSLVERDAYGEWKLKEERRAG